MHDDYAATHRTELLSATSLGTSMPISVVWASGWRSYMLASRGTTEDYCPRNMASLHFGRDACLGHCDLCPRLVQPKTMCFAGGQNLFDDSERCMELVDDWLHEPTHPMLGLGLGPFSPDALLFESALMYARRLVDRFGNPRANPEKCKLLLTTCSSNTHFFEAIPASKANIIVSFVINSELVEGIWEARDARGRQFIPSVAQRVRAACNAAAMGCEVRLLLKPILTPPGYMDSYRDLFTGIARAGLRPSVITLGNRFPSSRLIEGKQAPKRSVQVVMATGRGHPLEVRTREQAAKDGVRIQLPTRDRIPLFRAIIRLIRDAWAGTGYQPAIGLCLESRRTRQALGLGWPHCNCR